MHADPENAKKIVKLLVFFALLGSAHVKAARRTLMKLTPRQKIFFRFPTFAIKLESFNK